MKRLATLGECMVELRPGPDGAHHIGYAGDMLNSAFYARRTLPEDMTVSFFSGFGTDRLSSGMVSAIHSMGISTHESVVVPDRQCGLYMIHLDQGERSFSYWRSHSAARLLAGDRDRLRIALAGADTVLFSGITLAILEGNGAETLISLMAELRHAGVCAAFDPNIRFGLWADGDHMRACVSAAAAAASIVLPSYEDEATSFGDATKNATVERYLALGADLVALKDGKDGILLATPEMRMEIPAVPVASVVDSTGAGDSFNGIFLARLMMGDAPAEAAAQAAAGAAEVIQHHGAIVKDFNAMETDIRLRHAGEAEQQNKVGSPAFVKRQGITR